MNVLVSCDEYCYKYAGDYYLRDVGTIFTKRYLSVFDKLRFVIRVKEVYSVSELGKFRIKVTDPKIEIYPLDFFQGPIQYAKHYLSIRRKLNHVAHGCDVAILRLPSTVAFAVLPKLAAQNIPFATELVYDCYDDYKSENNIIYKILMKRMHDSQVNACKKAIGVAPVTAYYIQKHYPASINAIQSHYSSIELTDDFFYKPRTYPNEKECLTIVHVANQVQFNGRKGHIDLLNVLHILKKRNIVVKIVFIGEDYQCGIRKCKQLACELGIGSQVTFTGFLTYKDMRQQLLEGDIAVLPTKAEGLPRVVIEAMAMGLPCVTSRVSGNPELIEDEFLFEYGDVVAIVSAIEKLVTDKHLYEEVSERNFNNSKEYAKSVLDERRTVFYKAIRNIVELKN